MQRTRVNSRRKALKSSVDEEAAGVHQSVRFSFSLSLTKHRLTLIHRDRQWVQRDSSRRTKWRRKERRRNGRRTPRRMQVRIVRRTVITKRRSLRREVGRDGSLRHPDRHWSLSYVRGTWTSSYGCMDIWVVVLYFYISHDYNPRVVREPLSFLNKNECASLTPWVIKILYLLQAFQRTTTHTPEF